MNKKISVKIHKVGFFRKGIGLMFRTRDTENLLFEFRRDTQTPITSLFVFFDFLAFWLDEKNHVVEWSLVRPFEVSLSPSVKFRKLVEVPINIKNKKLIDFFVDSGKV